MPPSNGDSGALTRVVRSSTNTALCIKCSKDWGEKRQVSCLSCQIYICSYCHYCDDPGHAILQCQVCLFGRCKEKSCFQEMKECEACTKKMCGECSQHCKVCNSLLCGMATSDVFCTTQCTCGSYICRNCAHPCSTCSMKNLCSSICAANICRSCERRNAIEVEERAVENDPPGLVSSSEGSGSDSEAENGKEGASSQPGTKEIQKVPTDSKLTAGASSSPSEARVSKTQKKKSDTAAPEQAKKDARNQAKPSRRVSSFELEFEREKARVRKALEAEDLTIRQLNEIMLDMKGKEGYAEERKIAKNRKKALSDAAAAQAQTISQAPPPPPPAIPIAAAAVQPPANARNVEMEELVRFLSNVKMTRTAKSKVEDAGLTVADLKTASADDLVALGLPRGAIIQIKKEFAKLEAEEATRQAERVLLIARLSKVAIQLAIEDAHDDYEGLCQCCADAPRHVAILPCEHITCCQECMSAVGRDGTPGISKCLACHGAIVEAVILPLPLV